MNITFEIWKKTLKKVFSWEIWKKLIIISAIPIVLNTLLFQFFTGDVSAMMMRVQELSLSDSVLSGEMSTLELYQAAGYNSLMLIKVLLALLVAIEIGILIIATLHITTRESFKKGENSVTQNLFEKASDVFIPFHLYLARVVWYISWPVLLAIPVGVISSEVGIPVLPFVAPILGGVITFYRTLRSVFSIPFYFEFEGEKKETRKEIFEKSLTFTQGKALHIFFSLVGLSLVIGLAGMLIMILVLSVFSLHPEEISGMTSIIMSLPSVLFEGVTTVFFYVMYKVMKNEKS